MSQGTKRAKPDTNGDADLPILLTDSQGQGDRTTEQSAVVETLVRKAKENMLLVEKAAADVPGRLADALTPVTDALTQIDQILRALSDVRQHHNEPTTPDVTVSDKKWILKEDAALGSATSELRRAVTDIDWSDLPSASSAWVPRP